MRLRYWLILGAIGIGCAGILVGRLLSANGWNPTTTLRFGEAFPEQVEYAEGLLGEVVVAPQAGHDGKFYFSQALDPFYLEPERHAVYLDRPTYRAQRMLYPTLASAGGLLGAKVLSWGLIAINVAAMGVGTALTGALATSMGRSPWLGLAFVVNPGHLVALNIDSAEIVATSALMAGILATVRDRPGLAAASLCAAGLARETMIIGAAGVVVYGIVKNKKLHRAALAPFAVVGLWWGYVRWRLNDVVVQDTQAVDLPLRGFIQAARGWMSTPGREVDLLMGVTLLFTAIVIAVRVAKRPTALGLAVAGFAALAAVLAEPVWERAFDSSRALAPVITAYVLLAPAPRPGTSSADSPRTDFGDNRQVREVLSGETSGAEVSD